MSACCPWRLAGTSRGRAERSISAGGNPTATVHPVGGLSDGATDHDIDGFVQAANEKGAIGGGLYDDAISTAAQYGRLGPLAR